MNLSNYRINYKEKKPYKLLIIALIIVLLIFIFKPFTWLKNTLFMKSLEYKSTHNEVTIVP